MAEKDAKEKAIEDEEASKPKKNPFLEHIGNYFVFVQYFFNKICAIN